MRRLLGDSFSLSEGSLQNAARQKSPQPVKKLYKKSSEKSTVPSPTPEKHEVLTHQSLSPPPSRPESHMVRFTEHSVSSETDHSEIRSLDDLFPVAAVPDSDDTLSERSAVLDDFKLNVMTLDDLAPIPFEAAEISQEKKETQARQEDRNKKSSNISDVASPTTLEEASAAYESDFESEIPSETPESASEISERLTDKDKDASLISGAQYSSYKSQDGNDDNRNLSQSSSSCHSDSSSRSTSSNATVTHGPSPDGHVKEVAVQTQADGLTYTWSFGMAAVGPSLGMTYVDPTPIASHTVSAEAIESLTAYSPAVFALNDMLRQQLALTRGFIDSTRRHYTSMIESLGPADYKYTTLEDTKEFIRAHRPPKLSIEDALEEVLQEMRDYHYS
uniref:Si:ch1073-104i17.1 n=1 Tax=Cyprinus carpio TaxID=7962 RepID=A0A8C2GXS0_CYPCA